MHENDEYIASQVQNGDTERFSVLVERYEAKMTRYARRFLLDSDVIEDAVQEVFVKAYTNIQSFNTSMKFSPWIYRIAHNTYINIIKKIGKEPVTFFDPDTLFNIPSSDNIDEEYARKEDVEELNNHLHNLNPKYREPIVLFYFEDKGYKEIAEILHIPISTVGIRIKRGREKIKKQYT